LPGRGGEHTTDVRFPVFTPARVTIRSSRDNVMTAHEVDGSDSTDIQQAFAHWAPHLAPALVSEEVLGDFALHVPFRLVEGDG